MIRFGVHHDCTGDADSRQVAACDESLHLRERRGDKKFGGRERNFPCIGKARLVLHHLKITHDGFKLSRLRADHLPAWNEFTADVDGFIRRTAVNEDTMVENFSVVSQPPGQQIGLVEKMRYDDAHCVRIPWDCGCLIALSKANAVDHAIEKAAAATPRRLLLAAPLVA
jgi:hypothetical protein